MGRVDWDAQLLPDARVMLAKRCAAERDAESDGTNAATDARSTIRGGCPQQARGIKPCSRYDRSW